jgi:hypothetical protein
MKEKKDAELSNLVAEQKLRTQRILGELVKSGQANGELIKGDSGYNQRGGHSSQEGPKTLNDVGLTAKQSHTFQQIADIPEETFEKFIEEKKQAVNDAVKELTTSGLGTACKIIERKYIN